MRLIHQIIYLNFLLFVIFSFEAKAQYYSTGQDPASAKWSQINTDNFQIIFQEQFINKAQEVANILEQNYHIASTSLDHKPKKISVVLHNLKVISNGYVAWAPKRMELFTTPPQDVNPNSWLEHLCIHELRHVIQIDKLDQGITNVLSILFGQQAVGLVTGQLPLWYLEGDAVCTETALTNFGRGRLPSFEKGIRTHLLSDEKRYSFDKMLFGSYKDYTPNHYEFGYQLSSYVRLKFGSSIWSNVENHVARNSYTLLPTSFAFYRGLKKNTGLSQEDLYNKTFDHLDSMWSTENLRKDIAEPHYLQQYLIKEYEEYINPVIVEENTVLALKKGLSHIPQFILVKKDSETLIYEPGHLISNDFSYAYGNLVWAEYKSDIRWSNRDFTSIKLLNVKTLKTKVLVKKSRYFSPEFSPQFDKIAVVEVDEQNKSFLVILDLKSGSVLTKIPSKNESFIQRPQWSVNGGSIYVIEQFRGEKQVSKYSFSTNIWETVCKIEGSDIQKFRLSNDRVYFNSTYNGIDNIYVYDEKSQEIYQISKSENGITEFCINTNSTKLIVSEYTSQGSHLAAIPIERAVWKNLDQVQKYNYKFAETLKQQDLPLKSLKKDIIKEFPVKKFRKSLNAFNFHSWIPFNVDYDKLLSGDLISDPSSLSENIHPGITLLSQNKLSTIESILGYAYKNGNHVLSSSIAFKGKYPIIRLSANYGQNQQVLGIDEASWKPRTKIGYSYDLDIYVPFNFSSGKYIRGFRPYVSIEYFDDVYYEGVNKYFIKGVEFVQTGFLFYSQKTKAKRDIIPEIGGVFEFKLFNSPFESELFGYLYNINGVFYLPGWKNSGFKIDVGYQLQKPVLYRYNSNFRFPRGFLNHRSDEMYKIYCDYVFPIAYPDWNLGSLIYIKRFRGNLFVDYAFNSYKTVNESHTAYLYPTEQISSFGLEITADYHLLRTIFPLNTGVRFGYIQTNNKIFVNLIFGIDLYN